MRHLTLIQVALLSSFLLLFSSCEIVGDIFRAGMWVGIIIVMLVVGLVVWLISKARS